MKYYIYGTTALPDKDGYQPAGYLSKDSDAFKYILAVMEQAQREHQIYLKTRIVDDFNDTLIYQDKKSDKEISKYGLTFIGTVRWEFNPFNVFLTLNEDLKSQDITVELTEIECENLLRCFRDLTHYGSCRDLRHLYMGDREMAKSTLSKIERILDDNARTN